MGKHLIFLLISHLTFKTYKELAGYEAKKQRVFFSPEIADIF